MGKQSHINIFRLVSGRQDSGRCLRLMYTLNFKHFRPHNSKSRKDWRRNWRLRLLLLEQHCYAICRWMK